MNRLERLLRPKSIAFFGGGWAAAALHQTQKMGYQGDIWPVHPHKETVGGLRAYRSVADLPGAPDAVFVGVNREASIEIVRDLAARGTGGAVCFAAGFRETARDDDKGSALQDDLVAAAGGMPILGPNCYGLINYCDGALLWPDQHGGVRLKAGATGAAIVTQSSNIAINLTMQARGLPVSYVVTAGNQAQTGLSEIALGLIEDPRVSVLGLHIEGFDSVAGFERLAARARALGKPIVAMKVGRSEQARSATLSHTASLAGSDATSSAFLARLGIGEVRSIPGFLEALKLLHVVGPLAGPRLSSMSCSGGEASVMADAAIGHPVHFPPLGDAHRARVKSALGPLVAVANPLDYNTFIWNDLGAMTEVFGAFVSGGFDLNILIIDFPRVDRCLDVDWLSAVDAYAAALKNNGAKGVIVASMPENLSEDWSAAILKRGIAPMHGIAELIEAASAASAIGAGWACALPQSVLKSVLKGTRRTLSEAAAKARLGTFGLPVPQGHVVHSAHEAADRAESIGFPVALKVSGLAHKTEAGGVRLNLQTAQEVLVAADQIASPGDVMLVETMIRHGVGELIVGITRDALFGPALTIGTGGVLVELLADSRTLLLPATRDEIATALRSLKLFPLLDGYRGRAKADLVAALDVIAGIADFAMAHADDILELDINPLIVCEAGHGAVIADALLVTGADHD